MVEVMTEASLKLTNTSLILEMNEDLNERDAESWTLIQLQIGVGRRRPDRMRIL